MKKYFTREYCFAYYVPVLLFLVSFIWKYRYIDLRDISMDEPFTLFFSQQSLGDIWYVSVNGSNPPLFSIIMHYWISWFGLDASVVRLVPLLFNSLTIIFLYKTAQKVSGNAAAVLTSLLFLFSTAHFYFALETRTYSLISLGVAVAIYCYIRLQENPARKGYFITLFIANLVMVYCHYFSWFVLFNEVLLCALFWHNRKFFLRILLNICLVFVLYLPIFFHMMRQFIESSSEGTWVDPPYKGQLWNELLFWVNTSDFMFLLIRLLAAGVIIAGIAIAIRRYKPEKTQWKMLLFYAVWFCVPFFIMYFTSFSIPMFVNRYILFNSISFYLFIGAFVQLIFGFQSLAPWVVAIFISIRMFAAQEILPDWLNLRQVKKSVEVVKEHKTEGVYVFMYPLWVDFPLLYYYDRNLFAQPMQKDSLMLQEKLIPLFGPESARDIILAHHPQKVILYEDGGFPAWIHECLDSFYVRTDSVFFAQTTVVSIFDAKPKK